MSRIKQKQNMLRQECHSSICLSFLSTCEPYSISDSPSQFSRACSCAIRSFVRFSTFLRSSWMRCMLTCRGSGFFLGGIWGIGNRYGSINECTIIILLILLMHLETEYFWRLRTSGGRSVNTWRISPPVCLSCVNQRVDFQPLPLSLGLGSLIPHGFGSQIPNFVATWLVRSVSSRVNFRGK